MGMIEGVRIRNYRALKDIKLGKLWNEQNEEALTPMTVVIGKNGAGKSSIFDAFGFLADCLNKGVETAFDERGGYQKNHSKEQKGPIAFEIYYREHSNARPITYEVEFDLDKLNRPYVAKERLRQRRQGEPHGRPYSFLYLIAGKGVVWKGENAGQFIEDDNIGIKELFANIDEDKTESGESEKIELDDKRKLGIATLGALKQHPRISKFRKFIEGWYLSYFTPDAARSLPLAGPQKQLNMHGDNLSNVVQYMEREYKNQLDKVLQQISHKIPGLEKIDTYVTPDERILLQFHAEGFKKPFFAQQMSDGTLKVFAYLLLLASPHPAPFVCIEEPENGLYHKLLEILASEFRNYAIGNNKNTSQLFITTHQPYFVDNLQPNEVWILEKGEDGFSKISRASKDPLIVNMVKENFPLGRLWYSDYLDER